MNDERPTLRRAYRRWVIPGLIVVIIGWWWWWCWPCWFHDTTTVMLLRHADRNGAADALKTPEGTDRAAELVHVAGLAGITAIFHSDTERTRRTAQDLAAHLGLTPVEIPVADTQDLVDQILAGHRGERVLVVGHSNTVPDIIEALGGAPMPDLAHSVSDDFWVITLCSCRRNSPEVVHLKYGAHTPP